MKQSDVKSGSIWYLKPPMSGLPVPIAGQGRSKTLCIISDLLGLLPFVGREPQAVKPARLCHIYASTMASRQGFELCDRVTQPTHRPTTKIGTISDQQIASQVPGNTVFVHFVIENRA